MSVYHPYQLRKCKLETILRFHLTPTRMTEFNKTMDKNNAGEVVENEEMPFTVNRNARWCSHSRNQYIPDPQKSQNKSAI